MTAEEKAALAAKDAEIDGPEKRALAAEAAIPIREKAQTGVTA